MARPPIKAARDIGEEGRLLGAGAGPGAGAVVGAGERLGAPATASSPMSFRSASSWFLCLFIAVNGSSGTTDRSSALIAAAIPLWATEDIEPQVLRRFSRDVQLTQIDAVGPATKIRTPPHPSLSRGSDLRLEPSGLRILILIHLLLHSLDLARPFRKGRVRLGWYTRRASTSGA